MRTVLSIVLLVGVMFALGCKDDAKPVSSGPQAEKADQTPAESYKISEDEAKMLADVKDYLDKGGDPNADGRLLKAAGLGYLEVVKLLVAKGADIEAKNAEGRTALYLAARKGHQPVVKSLLAKGAKVDATDNEGRTPLHAASYYGHADAVKLLLAAGAAIDAKDKAILGSTPLTFAADQGQIEVVRFLLDAGADVDAHSDDGFTALHLAAGSGHAKTVSLLIAKGANVNAATQAKVTPLLSAMLRENKEVVEILLKNGADVNAREGGQWHQGWTALHYAARSGWCSIVELLIAHGADVNAKTESGQTPIDTLRFSGLTFDDKARTAELIREHGGKGEFFVPPKRVIVDGKEMVGSVGGGEVWVIVTLPPP